MEAGSVVIVGGGAAGLSAAYALGKRGIKPILLEIRDQAGGRLAGDRVGGFLVDTGARVFCHSNDVTFRICEELGVPLVPSKPKFGWYRNGRWTTTTPGRSAANFLRNINIPSVYILFRDMLYQAAQLGASSKGLERSRLEEQLSRLAVLDGDETFGAYLDRIGVPERLKVSLKGFMEMTMGHVEPFGQAAYIRTHLAEMMVYAKEFLVPENGAAALARALATACGDAVRVSTAVRRVVIRNGSVARVVTDDGPIKADAVICAVPATKVTGLIPGLPAAIRHALGKVTYSIGCRAVIGLDRPPLPPGWHGALYPEDDTPLLLDRSIEQPSCVPPGKSTLDMIVGRGQEMLSLADDEITRELLREARRVPPPGSALPGDDEWIFARVYRWREAVCIGRPGMFNAIADMRRHIGRDVGNLFFAGDYMRTPSVNGALVSGVDAAAEAADLLARRSGG
ncbi:MAG: NAD(P)/FAD-dependent oxidoreductase [Gemmatimonadetes bacterium]|nr:NAD(P)/FAD-dependent oxidoreductase [Gemmatimonadota bacterium]